MMDTTSLGGIRDLTVSIENDLPLADWEIIRIDIGSSSFLELAEKDRQRISIIDGSKSVDEIQKIIRDLIEEIL